MAALQLSLTSEERDFLVSYLERVRKETLVEEHRTKNLNYREGVVEQEKVIESLLSKLSCSPITQA